MIAGEHRWHATRRCVALIAAILVAASVFAVSAPPAGAGGASTGFETALAAVSAGPVSEQWFGWVDFATMRRLHLIPVGTATHASTTLSEPESSWLSYSEGVLPVLSGLAADSWRKDGFDPLASGQATSIGTPNVALQLDPRAIDSARLRTTLAALGAKPLTAGGLSLLGWGAENSLHQSGPVPFSSVFDRVLIGPDGLRAGPSVAAVSELRGVGKTMLTQPADALGAQCAGDVVLVEAAPPATFELRLPGAGAIVLGITAPASPSTTGDEVICNAFTNAAGARADLARLKQDLTLNTIDPITHGPLSELVSNITIELVNGPRGTAAVRVLMHPRSLQTMGFVLRAPQYLDLPELTGGSPQHN